MLKEGTNNTGGNSSNWSRVCDTCRSAPCIVYCRADSAYLCSGCDARIHAANRVASRHERVWVCEACERAPAAFLCKADAASLCSSCDADIHSANPLASRHHRVPILPISGYALFGEEDQHELNCNNSNRYEEEEGAGGGEEQGDDDEAEAASWLLPHPVKISNDETESNNGYLFGGGDEGDEYLDLELVDCNNSCCDNNNFGTVYHDDGQLLNYVCVPQQRNHVAADSAVPVQMQRQSQQFQQGIDFDSSKAASSYNGSISQSVSISSQEVGVVPDSTFSDVSISHTKPSMGTSDLFPPMPMRSLITPLDREARVLRYREKKKTRKFEKKIRYASRKAYAETRPRIKGRFAKRTDVEAEVDQMVSTTLMIEDAYGIVPSF